MRQVVSNAEMPNYTQALYDARELAMGRMQAEAAALGSDGVVGVRLVERSHGWESHIVEHSAVGTAVSVGEAKGLLTPQLVLPLQDS